MSRITPHGLHNCISTPLKPYALTHTCPRSHPIKSSSTNKHSWPPPFIFSPCRSVSTSFLAQLCTRRAPLLGPPLSSTGYFDSHGHTRKCFDHRLAVPEPIPPVTPPRARPSPPHDNCCGGVSTTLSLPIPHCRRPGCLELGLCGRGGAPTNDNTVTPVSPVHATGFGQFNCRRLWVRDGSVHGIMGPVISGASEHHSLNTAPWAHSCGISLLPHPSIDSLRQTLQIN